MQCTSLMTSGQRIRMILVLCCLLVACLCSRVFCVQMHPRYFCYVCVCVPRMNGGVFLSLFICVAKSKYSLKHVTNVMCESLSRSILSVTYIQKMYT